MQINLSKMFQNETALVVFSIQNEKDRVVTAKVTHRELFKHLKSAIDEKSITGKSGESIIYREINFLGHRHVVVIGLGLVNKINPESVRQSAAAIHSSLKSLNIDKAAIDVDGIPSGKKEGAHFLQALIEGLLLTDYSFDELKSKKTNKNEADQNKTQKKWVLNFVSGHALDAAFKKANHEAHILAESVNFSRRLGDLPGNLMTPIILSNTAATAAKGTGLKVTTWDKARLEKEHMGGLLGVSRGSAQEPRFIIIEHRGSKKPNKKPLVFVGKGLTFDSGGISLKPGSSMEEMKYDMCGGANVIGTMLAIAKLKLNLNVTALIPATENMPGPAATKPGDIHTARNGKTFEVNNTDAEGRLILADALSYASELKPELIVDVATLTGAMVIALGNIHTGYFTRNDSISKKIENSASTSGESIWRMPLCDHHTKDMKGTFADLSNMSSSKGAGSSTATAFLEQFVEEGIPWAHFDIAGTAWAVGSRLPYCSKKGASGCMIRTFVELAKQYI